MSLWKILSSNILLLLFTWRFNKVSGNFESSDDALDQMATSSFIRMRNFTGNNSTLERPSIRDFDITTIRYENSNGFVPIMPESQTMRTVEEASYAENVLDRNLSNEKHLSLFIRNPDDSIGRIDEPLDRDPFYSSEARIFLSLTKPFTNRRSSNVKDSINDFELLKINDDTPSVASYQNFYKSLNSGSGRNPRARETGTQENFQTQNGDKMNLQNTKRAENYPSNNQNNPPTEERRNAASGANQRYYSHSQMNEGRNNPNSGYSYPKPENIDYNSKINDNNNNNVKNFQQQNYDQLQGYRHLNNINNNNNNDDNNDQQNSQTTSQPTDVTFRKKHPSKQNSKFIGKQNPTVGMKPSISENVGSEKAPQNSSPSPRQEETVSYFEHEALFNRDESVDKTGDEDSSDENYEYVEITEKPKRFRKQRKRPSQSSRDSGRLPKEHRDFEEEEESSSGKRKTRYRQKARSHKMRGNSWFENEDESGEEDPDFTAQGNVDSENRNRQRFTDVQNRRPKENTWNNVSPNVEISHSNGIEIDQIGKPKLVLPLKVNLLPVANFDHRTALGNSQGFDLSNAVLHNFVTATPITFGTIRPVAGITNTPQNIFGQNAVKTLQNLQNQNLKVQTSAPDVIVGHNGFHNSVQTILMPQVSDQNYQTQLKLAQNERNAFSSNGQNSFTQNSNPNFNLLQQQQNQPTQNLPVNSPAVQNPLYIPNQNMAQSFQNFHLNQEQNQGQSNLQTNEPHPTPQTFENYQQQKSNYNLQVNPRGLQGHSLPANQNLYTSQGPIVFPTTPMPIFLQSGNIDGTSSQGKRNYVSGSNGQFLASASLTVGEQTQNQINPQNLRPQIQENYQQSFRQDNVFPKIKTFNQITEASQQAPLNSNGQQIFGRDNQAEQFSQASNAIAQNYKDQNQQILKVANEIFESTLERLKQLQKNQNFRSSRPESSQNLFGQDIAAGLKKTESHIQNSGVKNVEIVTPNSGFSNPFENSNGFNGLSLTTAFPIFATTGFDPSLRSPIGQSSSINGYVNSLTEIGAKEKDVKTSPTISSRPNSSDLRYSPVLFNPINFVPNLETLKNQNTLNNKHSNGRDTSLHGLNLVPIIPGGNFYKHSYNAQEDLFSKPKLTTDLQKYAEEMFKESLRTMYNTQKWNNDHKAQSSEISSVTASPKVKDEFRNLKFSAPDIKPSKQILEAHYTESGSKDADIQSQKKFPSKVQDLGEILKQNKFNLPPPIAFEPVRFYYKPNIHLTRPTMSDLNNPDLKFESDFGSADYIHDFLIPPKPNAFLSKSPFNDDASKRRPRPKKPISDSEKVKFFGRPDSSSPRPSSSGVVETATSNIAPNNFPFDTPRQEFLYKRPSFDHEDSDFDPDYHNSHSLIRGNNFQSWYPSITTSQPLAEDFLKPSFQKYDFNHPRMHNLLGLLRKNKKLPADRSQNYFEKKENMESRFEDRESRERSLNILKDESSAGVENIETGLNLTRTTESS